MANYREDRPGAGPGASSQEQSVPHQRTHEELVAGFRALIDPTEKRGLFNDIPVPPEQQLTRPLYTTYQNAPFRSDKERFFKPLLHAWQLLTYDRLEPGSIEEDAAARAISDAYKESPIIKLNETQVRTLDAMAEAAGIPRCRGQSEIPIPEQYADSSWRFDSPEWMRAAKANHERVNRDAALYKKGYRKRL